MTKMRWLIAASLGLALVGAGVGVGAAANALREGASTVEHGEADDGESDEPLTGTDAERAAATALEYTNAAYGVGR